jgi:hypothetical protein
MTTQKPHGYREFDLEDAAMERFVWSQFYAAAVTGLLAGSESDPAGRKDSYFEIVVTAASWIADRMIAVRRIKNAEWEDWNLRR